MTDSEKAKLALGKIISFRKADMARKYPNQRISRANVAWGTWVDPRFRRVQVVFSCNSAVACFTAVADYFTEEVVSSTSNGYEEM
jgi:hypothetical protein